MRLPNHDNSRREGLDIKMTPMIDVVFLLLVFFVWTASFGVVERLLPSDVASAQGMGGETTVDPELVDFEQVVVRIQWQDEHPMWQINSQQLSGLDEVRSVLSTIASIKSDLPVVVDPQDDVPLGHVIDVYDVCRQVGFSKIHFTAVPQ
jgi:biopolymer transport protein ExbD